VHHTEYQPSLVLVHFLLRQYEKSFLRDSHESRGAHHAENDQAPEFVMWQVHASQAVAQLGKQKGNEATGPLKAKQDHSAQADPRVQRVHVGYGLGRFVVRVEDSLERDRGKDEHGHLNERMEYLDIQFGCVSQQAIDQHGLFFLFVILLKIKEKRLF
jgi:hypothetical protein